MHIVCVRVRVVPGHEDDFIAATLANARHAVRETGCIRFDVLRNTTEPDRFLLYEVYRDAEAAGAHKETPHYLAWREAVADWMAEPRQGIPYAPIFPPADETWVTRLPATP